MLLQRLNNRKGFTLLELMIVVFIILILVATIVPMLIKCTVNTEVIVPEKNSIQQEQKEVNKQDKEMKKL